jgi:hypothetical protein
MVVCSQHTIGAYRDDLMGVAGRIAVQLHGLRRKLRLLCAGKPYWATKDEFSHGRPRLEDLIDALRLGLPVGERLAPVGHVSLLGHHVKERSRHRNADARQGSPIDPPIQRPARGPIPGRRLGASCQTFAPHVCCITWVCRVRPAQARAPT